ncbi:hypothetical protein B0H11DRAFT_1908757 [Mycena galericulata]|nr:hypothetical protein B0H11DRAFT_1908757 [Mycena galericulata]
MRLSRAQKYLGVKFDKKFAHDALKLWSSSATDLEEYLGPAAIENAPKVGEWLESKGKTYGSKLRKMRMARFQGYIKEDHAKSYRKKAGGSRWVHTQPPFCGVIYRRLKLSRKITRRRVVKTVTCSYRWPTFRQNHVRFFIRVEFNASLDRSSIFWEDTQDGGPRYFC